PPRLAARALAAEPYLRPGATRCIEQKVRPGVGGGVTGDEQLFGARRRLRCAPGHRGHETSKHRETDMKMRALLLTLLAAGVVGLVFGVGQASAWQKDPDITIDSGNVTTIITDLLAPDVTIGDGDTTPAGIADAVVGIENSLTDP